MRMKKLLLLPAFLLLLLASCGQGGWVVFEGDAWTAEFPGTPKDTATMEGDVSGIKVFYEPPQGHLDSNVYYAVSQYTTADTLSELSAHLEKLFRADVQVYAWGVGTGFVDTLVRPVKAGAAGGYEYRVTVGENAGIARIRKFAWGKRIYTVMVLTENSRLLNTQADRFLNSFKLK